MLRVIDEVRPTWVVGENVAGITTMVESYEVTDMGGETSLFEEDHGVHRFRSEHIFTIERICRDLESKGYSVQPMLIPACAVGAPHRRDRVFIIANTDCWGRSEVDQHLQSELTDGAESIGNGGEWDAADSKVLLINGGQTRYGGDGVGQEVSQLGGCYSEAAAHTESQRGERCGTNSEAWGEEQEQFGRVGGESIARMLPGKRWKGFPAISAVHRGNDGLPFDVDDLTISFPKWRNESLKAYGNAIVPQVMYRIFQCIEQITLF